MWSWGPTFPARGWTGALDVEQSGWVGTMGAGDGGALQVPEFGQVPTASQPEARDYSHRP